MDEKDIIDEYLSRDDQTKENANYSRSASGLEAYIARKTIKHKVLNEEYPSWVSKMHYDGDFHVHNLRQYFIED